MSLMTIEAILCDFAEDCETEPPFTSSSITVTREEAAKAGWITMTGARYDGQPETLDYCPEHADAALTIAELRGRPLQAGDWE